MMFSKTIYQLLLPISLTIVSACESSVSETQKAPSVSTASAIPASVTLEKGTVIPNIPLKDYPAESYALFLPQTYQEHGEYPVIFFLDPHGDGSLPLRTYEALASQYNVILIGSNNSKNGNTMEQNLMFAEHLIADAKKRLPLDSTKTVLCGFSGGAKVALLEGWSVSTTSHIIYSGAVVPVQPNSLPKKLLGFAGESDMNYTDLVQFERSLPTQFAHYLIAWNGKHEWPNESTFKDAFEWLNTGNVVNYASKKASISDAQIATEQNIKQQYIQAFQSKELSWWTTEINTLNAKKASAPMYERLLGFISLACYSYAGSLLQQHNLPAAEKIITIYQLADPNNEDARQFRQQLESMK